MKQTLNEIIELIAREKCIKEEQVREALRENIKKIAISQYGNEHLIDCSIFPDGSFEVFINREIVERAGYDEFEFISLRDAKERIKDAYIGGIIKEVLPVNLNNFEIKEMLFSLKQGLNKMQKDHEYEVFADKVGTIVVGYIKRVDAHEVIISFSDGEGILRRNKTLQNDVLKASTYIKMYVEDVRKSDHRQIILSRTHPNFLKELLKNEVLEISEGIIEIKAIARDCGSLSKIAVHSNVSSINPIKVCIGEYGSKIQNVSKELSGEKINIVLWNENINQFIANALSPIKVLKVIEKRDKRFEVVVAEEDFNKAMGRGGQNISLVKRLCHANSIKLLTEQEEREQSQKKILENSKKLIEDLEIEEMMAHLLVSEGFDSSMIIANTTAAEISNLNGFDEELSQILIERAKAFIEKEKDKLKEKLFKEGKDTSLFELNLTNEQIEMLVQNEICTKNDLAILDASELKEILENTIDSQISFETACEIISSARNLNWKE